MPNAADAMVSVLADYRAERCGLWITLYLAEQAKAYLRDGRLVDAEACIGHATEIMERNGEQWALAELLRTSGRILEADGYGEEAARAFGSAMEAAQEQRAWPLALRTTPDLARAMVGCRRGREARAVLESVLATTSGDSASKDRAAALSTLAQLPR